MAEGRNTKGQFIKGHQHAKGNKGGPGRPPRAREERYQEILSSTCSFSDWRKIIQQAVVQAKKGDKHARDWLTNRLVGSVTAKLDIDMDVRETLNEDLENALGRILAGPSDSGDAGSAD